MKSSIPATIYLSPNGYLGGAEKAMIHFCLGHIQNGKAVSILFFSTGDALAYAQQLGISTFILPHSFKLSNPLQLIKALRWIRNLIRKHEFKIIHATMAYGHIVSALATIALPIKRVWFQHGPVAGTLDKIANLLPVDQIYFNSTFLQTLHNTSYITPIPYEKEFIIPYGINHPKIELAKIQIIKQTYTPKDGHLFLLAGRICAWKGYETAIEALSQVTTIPWHLLIIGSAFRESDKQYERSLHQLVTTLNLQQHVTFIPFQKDIYHFFHAADTFIHSANTPEPFGLVVAEAMLQKTFVIGSSQGGIKDILIDQQTGFSFNSLDKKNSSSELYKKINCRLQLNDSEVKRIITTAYNLISQRHAIKHAAYQLERCYQKLQ